VLERQYAEVMPQECVTTHAEEGKRRIWTCWLQGMEQAPEMVKCCVESMKRNFPEREVVVITRENMAQWVTMPQYIMERYRKGRMPEAMMSDLLRLELLHQYGGTWMDATVFCSGWSDERERERTLRAMDAEVLFFQYTAGKEGRFAGIANWFISAQQGNAVIARLRAMLWAYWRDYDCVVDYYMMHRFFDMIVKRQPEVLMGMPRGYARPCLELGTRLAMDYDESWWREHAARVCFHKLSHRKTERAEKNERSYLRTVVMKRGL